jgi:hypothetical protein
MMKTFPSTRSENQEVQEMGTISLRLDEELTNKKDNSMQKLKRQDNNMTQDSGFPFTDYCQER